MAVWHEYKEYFLTTVGWTTTDYHRGKDAYILPTNCLRAFQTSIEEGNHPTPGVWATEIFRSDDADALKKAIAEHGEIPEQMLWLKEKEIFAPQPIE